MKRIGWVTVIAVFLGLSAFAFGMISRQGRPNPPAAVDARPVDQHAGHAERPDEPPATRAYRDAATRIHADMDIPYSGDADVDFLRGMIAHHQGAIAMAKVVVEHGEAEDVRGLAEEIISAQEAEIVRMRIMLARHEDAPVDAARR